jgi:N-methylhydantoinase A/oxoprolinase/acetone carboxylase beta subunit
MASQVGNDGLRLGVDTGGTYTDAVVVDSATGSVQASAKAPTSHHDLGLGVLAAVRDVLQAGTVDPRDIEAVAISTTLATNAVVEDHGARVGLVVIGHDKPLALPADSAIYLPGGHTINGEEVQPLNVEMLLKTVAKFKGHVDAYAVCAAMSFANPTHELVAAKAIELTDAKPVFCSHAVSQRAGLQQRAATTTINARLMPVMQNFLARVTGSLADLGIPGDIAVVRGDGRTMTADEAVERAATSVASGPAATAWFGAGECPAATGLVVDVGGTTTDISLIEEGRPVVDTAGSRIGCWETHVDALRTCTVGVGGDSHVTVARGQCLSIGPGRVVPLAMAKGGPSPAKWLGLGTADRCVLPSPGMDTGAAEDGRLLALLAGRGGMTPGQLAAQLGMGEIAVAEKLKQMIHTRQVMETGFTPTDALIALGELDLGEGEAALAGAGALADLLECSREEVCRRVLAGTRQSIEDAMVDHLLHCSHGSSLAGILPERRRHPWLRLDIGLRIPIVGIGAAACCLLPQVARNLQAELVLPDHYAVGNAVGAVRIAAASGIAGRT